MDTVQVPQVDTITSGEYYYRAGRVGRAHVVLHHDQAGVSRMRYGTTLTVGGVPVVVGESDCANTMHPCGVLWQPGTDEGPLLAAIALCTALAGNPTEVPQVRATARTLHTALHNAHRGLVHGIAGRVGGPYVHYTTCGAWRAAELVEGLYDGEPVVALVPRAALAPTARCVDPATAQ